MKDVRVYIIAFMVLIFLSALLQDFSVFYPYSHKLIINYITTRSWDTITAGLLALTGAAWTVMHLRTQNDIQQEKLYLQREEIKDREVRLSRTARALMPQNISDGLSWINEVMLFIYDSNHETGDFSLLFPKYPKQQFTALAEAAQYLPEECGELLVQICRNAQIFCSRMDTQFSSSHEWHRKSTSKKVATTHALLSYIYTFVDDKWPINAEEQNPIGKDDHAQALIGLDQIFDPTIANFDKKREYFKNSWGIKNEQK